VRHPSVLISLRSAGLDLGHLSTRFDAYMVTEMKDKTADCPINSQSKRSAGIDKVEGAQAFRCLNSFVCNGKYY
jgi:hypothetical protein